MNTLVAVKKLMPVQIVTLLLTNLCTIFVIHTPVIISIVQIPFNRNSCHYMPTTVDSQLMKNYHLKPS